MNLKTLARAFALISTLAVAGTSLGTLGAAGAAGARPGLAAASAGVSPVGAAAAGTASSGTVALATPSGGAPVATPSAPPVSPAGLPANIVGSTGTMRDFLVSVIRDVDAYWAGVWRDEGRPTPVVGYAFPAAGEVAPTACFPGYSDDLSAFYCVLDDKIVVSQSLARRIWDGTLVANADGTVEHATGDFSVAYVVAHEYAHSLQAELGIFSAAGSLFPVYKIELHADCWAGVWAKAAEDEGILNRGDIAEAMQTTLDLGDYAVDNPQHHGTPEQRNGAFTAGYEGGSESSCDPYLFDSY